MPANSLTVRASLAREQKGTGIGSLLVPEHKEKSREQGSLLR